MIARASTRSEKAIPTNDKADGATSALNWVVETKGIEPSTFALRTRRSPS